MKNLAIRLSSMSLLKTTSYIGFAITNGYIISSSKGKIFGVCVLVASFLVSERVGVI